MFPQHRLARRSPPVALSPGYSLQKVTLAREYPILHDVACRLSPVEPHTLCCDARGSKCEGFRMPAASDIATGSGGRRPKASRGGNRDVGTCGGAAVSMGIWLRRVGI